MSSSPELAGPRSAPALKLIALIGAALSFNRVRLAATPYAGLYGGIGTALLFDAAMWLASRWYLGTVRAGKPLRPALWLSLALAALTLIVNVNGTHGLADQITHGIGPALFAAFTWLEAALQLRAYREEDDGQRERVARGYVIVHPARSARITLMMLGTGQRSFTAARSMCQNREATRRRWRADHGRVWRHRVDPVVYTAYRWGAFDANALTLTGPSAVLHAVPENVPDGVPEPAPQALPESARGTVRELFPAPPAPVRKAIGPPPVLTSGRDLSAAQVADLIRAAGPDRPGVRQVKKTFAVSYDKARAALDLLDGDSAA